MEEKMPSDAELIMYSYYQEFEKEDPFKLWTSNGTFKVNYKGLCKDETLKGNKIFKIDITFDTATYVYWKIPLGIPCEGELEFQVLGNFVILRHFEEAGRADADGGLRADVPGWFVVTRVAPVAWNLSPVGLEETVKHHYGILPRTVIDDEDSAGVDHRHAQAFHSLAALSPPAVGAEVHQLKELEIGPFVAGFDEPEIDRQTE